MSRFETRYKHYTSYEEQIDLEIKFEVQPTKEDYQSMLDAIDTLRIIADRYLPAEELEGKQG